MNRLETINTLPIEIAQLLGNDTQLQQLLIEDDNRLSKENFQKLNLNELLKNFKDSEDPINFAESNTDGQSQDVLKKYDDEKDIPEELRNMKLGEVKLVKANNVFEKNKIYKLINISDKKA